MRPPYTLVRGWTGVYYAATLLVTVPTCPLRLSNYCRSSPSLLAFPGVQRATRTSSVIPSLPFAACLRPAPRGCRPDLMTHSGPTHSPTMPPCSPRHHAHSTHPAPLTPVDAPRTPRSASCPRSSWPSTCAAAPSRRKAAVAVVAGASSSVCVCKSPQTPDPRALGFPFRFPALYGPVGDGVLAAGCVVQLKQRWGR